MKTITIQLVLLFSLFQGFSQNKTAYQIYTANGEIVSYEKMLTTLNSADIILFGELHNNPISHWLQYETTLDLSQSAQLIMGAEMLEADNQDELNQYLKGDIDQKALDTLARLWPNYKTDYAPLVNLAKEKQISFIATNIPRRYANMVFKKGFESLESLTDEEKNWIAPLPIEYDPELPGYKNIQSMMGGHGGENLPKAQAIKDATMAYFISENYITGSKFIHYHGTYHTDNYEGILWYLKKLKPELKFTTISTVIQADVNSLLDENKGKADFIICVDENMTSTY
jgi:uncharacterized iron-regulated protein